MYQYDDPTVTASLPASTGEGTPGYFTDGNPAGGQAATILRAEFMNMLMMEMVNAITGAGITPSKDTFTQLRSAIEAYITARTASTTVAGIVELATSAETQAGSSAVLAVTPSGLASRSATETRTGLAELATAAEVAAGSDTTRIVVPATLNGVFVGAVLPFAMSSAPAGWLKCNGAAVSRTTYAALFAAVGTVFGVGDGSTTFNLPDLRGEFFRGWDDGKGTDAGRVFGSGQGHAMQRFIIDALVRSTGLFAGYSTSYSFTASPGSSRAITTPGTGGEVATEEITARSAAEDWSTPTNSTVAFAQETRPINKALLICIKY